MIDEPELLRLLADRCQRNLAQTGEAHEFLGSNDIIAEHIWAAYRVGVGDKSLISEFDAACIQML